MLGSIWNFVKSWIFGKDPKPIKPEGPVVVNSYLLREDDGTIVRVIKYSDGSTKKEPYDAQDPSGVDDFIDNIRD